LIKFGPAVVITPYEIFSKKVSEPESKPPPNILVKTSQPDIAASECKVFEGVVKNAKTSLRRENDKTSAKRSAEIDEELKGIDVGKVKKTASVYSDSKEKADASKNLNLPPSRKIAQLFKAEFKYNNGLG
jgi:hypothetical protein